MQNSKIKIDTDKELKAIIDFTKAQWNGFERINQDKVNLFFSTVWNKSLEQFEKYFSSEGTRETSTLFKLENIKNSPNYIKVIEQVCQLYFGFDILQDEFSNRFKYENFCDLLTTQAKADEPELTKIKPKGWIQLAKNYSDYNGMSEYAEEQALIDKKMFKGVDSGGAGAGGFHIRISLPHVMYDDKSQARKPLLVLVGAIVGHALFVATHNNNLEIQKNIEKIKNQFNDFGSSDIKEDFSISPYLENSILKSAIEVSQKKREEEAILEVQANNPDIKKIQVKIKV